MRILTCHTDWNHYFIFPQNYRIILVSGRISIYNSYRCGGFILVMHPSLNYNALCTLQHSSLSPETRLWITKWQSQSILKWSLIKRKDESIGSFLHISSCPRSSETTIHHPQNQSKFLTQSDYKLIWDYTNLTPWNFWFQDDVRIWED